MSEPQKENNAADTVGSASTTVLRGKITKENKSLKASQVTQPKPSIPQQVRIDVGAPFSEVRRLCDNVILINYERLPTMFAYRQELESFRKSAKQKFLTTDTFIAYRKSQETRLKTIEEKLGRRFSLLIIN